MKNSLNEQLSKIDSLLSINAELDAALRSNKEDTSFLIVELGDAFTELAEVKENVIKLELSVAAYKAQQSRAWIGATIMGTGCGVGTGILVNGLYNQDPNQIVAGITTDLVSGIVWTLGHYLLKWF